MTTALFVNIHVDYYKYSHSIYSLCFYTINEPVLEINSIRDSDSMGGDTPFELLLLIQLFFKQFFYKPHAFYATKRKVPKP